MNESTTADNVEQQFSQLNLNGLQPSTSSSQVTEVQATTSALQFSDWRQFIDPDLRMNLINKILQLTCPGFHPQAVISDPMKYDYVEHARKSEIKAFETAKSSFEYCELITEKLSSIHNEKRQQADRVSWRNFVDKDVRTYIVHELVRTIVPGCDYTKIDYTSGERNSFTNLLEFARKLENDIYEAATSRLIYHKSIYDYVIYHMQN